MSNNTPNPYSSMNITTIVIEDGITTIGDQSFQNCASLTTITLPNTLISIGRVVYMAALS